MNVARPFAVVAVGALALAAAGCKSSPCAPPACMAEVPQEPAAACPPPAPMTRYTPSRPVASAPAPVAPKADPEMQSKIDILRTSVEAQHRQNAEIEAKIREIEAGRSAAPVVAATAGSAGGEQAARRIAEELKGVPGASVLVEGSTAVVVITDSFDSGVDRLKNNPDVRSGLRAVAMAVARHPEARVTVTGHTDSVPIQRSKWADNNALSQARAEMVAKTLVAGGAPRDRMTVKGVGSADPMVSPEKTASDRAKNRRVEVAFAFGK
ncbi:MAG: OmpA family protein [Planctomycetia bacterium]|nr:OmpA family protein [Planctomycetia bacterium]